MRAPTSSTARRTRSLVATAAIFAAVSCSVVGCSGATGTEGPRDALRTYARAIEDGRLDDAYKLLSEDARRQLSFEAFKRAIEEARPEALEVARALARPASDPTVTAVVTVPNGEELRLVFERGEWRVDAAAIDLYGQTTPRQALVGFIRAFERKRFDVILRYVPDAEREGAVPKEGKEGAVVTDGELSAERLKLAWEGPQKATMDAIVQALKVALPTSSIEETGEFAAMAYGSGDTVSLIRERGVWKIKDF